MMRQLLSASLILTLTSASCLAQVDGTYVLTVPSRYKITDHNFRREMPFANLLELAVGGDGYASYLVGRAYESGLAYGMDVTSGGGKPAVIGVPYLTKAAFWYYEAARRNNLNALFHLGLLLVNKKVNFPEKAGGLSSVDQGKAYMSYATSQGYSPFSDAIYRPQESAQPQQRASVRQAPESSNSKTEEIRPSGYRPPDASVDPGVTLLGVGVLSILALALLGNSHSGPGASSTVSGADTTKNPHRSCQIAQAVPVQNPAGSTYSTTWETRYTMHFGNDCP